MGELELMDIFCNVLLDKFIWLRIVGGFNFDKVVVECNLCWFRNFICMYKDLSLFFLFFSLWVVLVVVLGGCSFVCVCGYL